MNVVLLLAHSIEEHDQLKLLSELGYDVFSIGGYIDPAAPHDPKRPALPDAPRHPELQAVVDRLGTPDNLDAAKRHIPDDILDWADTIICHHYESQWLLPQWDRIKHKRVIWRTVGQSVEGNERLMAPLRKEGLQIVRYSPKERNIPGYAGEDALIRFYKDPDEWCGWTGNGSLADSSITWVAPGYFLERPFVLNITQHLRQRDPYTNWRFWEEATKGLSRLVAGPGSEILNKPGGVIEGAGELSYEQMKLALRVARAYLYTGTQPASYTLGLIEAMMTGIPVVSIGPKWMRVFDYGPDLFEGHELVGEWAPSPEYAKMLLEGHLNDFDLAQMYGFRDRQSAIAMFGKAKIGAEWKAFLG